MEFEPIALVIAALAAIIVAALASRGTGVATPLILLVMGSVIGLIPAVPEFAFDPEWILVGVLPPLLYAAAVRVPVIDMRRDFRMISWLSVTLVIVSAVAVGAVVHLLVPAIPFAAGVALGAVVSPTDAVAATAIGKRLGLPRRVMTVLEGESLLNDASALVLLRTAIAATTVGFSLTDALWDFGRAVLVAVLVGLVVGHTTLWLRSKLDDPVLTTAVSFVVPFLAFLPAEEADASGVVAVVVAGLVTGHLGARRLSARERSTESTNWTTLQFLIENGVFLLMGLHLQSLVHDMRDAEHDPWQVLVLVVVILAVLLVLRLVFVLVQVYGQRHRRAHSDETRQSIEDFATRIEGVERGGRVWQRRLDLARMRVARGHADLDFYEREPMTLRGGAVITWAGMRGVVTLAAALTIPVTVPQRELLVAVAFTVAVVSLLVYGGTLPMLIRIIKVRSDDPDRARTETASLVDDLSDGVRESLGDFEHVELNGERVDPDLLRAAWTKFDGARHLRREAHPAYVSGRDQMVLVKRHLLDEMREQLHEQRAIGAYSSAALGEAERILDEQELRLES